MKKVIVTGAGGFIGSHLTEMLAKAGYSVTAFVHYNSRNNWGWLEESELKDSIHIIAGDVRDADMVRAAVKGADTVFHLAALIGIPYSYHSPEAYVDTNVKGTLNILQAARDFGTGRVVITSTSEVYGTAQTVPISEDHPYNPQSPYAAAKCAADVLALSFFRSFGTPVVIVRPFNAFGPRQSSRAVIPTIMNQILSGARVLSLGSVAPTRDFTFVADTARGFIRAGEAKGVEGEIINLGTNSEISIGELAGRIASMAGVPVSVKCEECRTRPAASEVERLRADNTKALKLLGWKPERTFSKGLEETLEWFRRRSDTSKASLYTV